MFGRIGEIKAQNGSFSDIISRFLTVIPAQNGEGGAYKQA